MKIKIITTHVIFVLTYLSNFAYSQEPKNTFNLGFSAVLSGPQASYGEHAKNSIILATKTTQNSYKIDFQDDVCDPKKSLTNIQRFASKKTDKIDAVILLCMEALESAAKVAQRYNLPIFSIGYTSDDILKKYPNVFSLFNYADADAKYLVEYLKNHEKDLKSLSIIYMETNIGELYRQTFEDAAKNANFKIVSSDSAENVSGTVLDYSTIALRVIKHNPDGVFVQMFDENLPTFIKELRRIGYKGKLFTWFPFENDKVKADNSPLLDNVYYPFPIGGNNQSQETTNFVNEYKKEFNNEPNTYAMSVYDSMKIIDRILSGCKDQITIECVKENYLKVKEFVGVAGKVSLLETRGAIREYGIKQFKDNEFRWLK